MASTNKQKTAIGALVAVIIAVLLAFFAGKISTATPDSANEDAEVAIVDAQRAADAASQAAKSAQKAADSTRDTAISAEDSAKDTAQSAAAAQAFANKANDTKPRK